MSETDTASAAYAAEFERWANVFTAHKAFSHPSELHGALCGRLAAGSRIEEDEWLAMVCEHMGLPESAAAEADDLSVFMNEAYERVLVFLKSADMSFHPLLPDDDYAIDQRLEALVAWVRGFLEGMALSAGESLGEAPDEIRELIEDMVAISQVSEEQESDQESEQQLVEITEYIRLGALAVFTEFNPPEKPASQAPTLH
ncbi:MAG: yecA family protein [Marinobacter maritimus]|jgi:yecA family protein